MNTPSDPTDKAPPETRRGAGGGQREQRQNGDADISPSRRVFVVEDEFLVALLLEEELQALGFSIVGPFTTVATAMEAVRHERFDFAILDINLSGEMVFPLADELSVRGIPFLFVSGYGAMSRPERHRAVPYLAKPYEQTALVREIERLLASQHRA